MRVISFTQDAFREYNAWTVSNPKTFDKIIDLVKEIAREPFKGKGKPEPLKGEFKGYWSRRINDEDRLIYMVNNDTVKIVKCKGHYK